MIAIFPHKCYRIKFQVPEIGKEIIRRTVKTTTQQELRNYYIEKRSNELQLIILRTTWRIRTWKCR